ncbi:MAG: zinc-binding dehydrogenase [bacterium]
MRQAVMTLPGTIKLLEVSAPEPGPGEILLRIRRIGICGSDVHVNHGRHPYACYPVVQGHEFSGVVEAVGEGVTGIKPGKKATAIPQIVCGKCRPCIRGDYHICDNLKVQGFQAPGVAQDFFVTPAGKVVPLPDSFTLEQGALVEPVSVAVHAMTRVYNLAGKNVAVLGAGPIGNLVAQVAKCEGANVLITDLSNFRLDIARRCGIEWHSNAQKESLVNSAKRVFGDHGFDVAFECVGVEATMTSAIESIEKGGTIVVVGVFGEKPRINLGLVQDHELNIIGSLMYQYRDFERAVELIASGNIITAPLESKHFPLEEFAAAYKFIDEQEDRSMKVFIDL